MKLELFKISDLKLDPENARKHNAKNLKAISNSFREFDQLKNIVVDKNNVVICGNGTVQTFMDEGKTEIWGVRSHLSDEKNRAFALADNRTAELAEWDTGNLEKIFEKLRAADIKLDDVGFEPADLDDLGLAPKNVGLTDDDAVPEVAQNIHGVTLGDIWQLGEHRLMCGDSTKKEDVEKLMAGEKADLWLTDPPYGVDIKQVSIERYEKTGRGNTQSSKNEIANDIASKDGWNDVLLKCFANAYFATTDKASHYVFSCQGSDKQMMMMMVMQETGWNFRHEILWVKNRFILGRSDYHYQHEPCLYGWKEKGTHEWFGGRDKSSVLQFDVMKNDLHPTMKPVGLLEQLISNSSKQSGKVIDTFCGSGSTLIACEKTNRKCYGMEIDPHYCSVIIERWQQFTGKKSVKLDLTNS